jgi:uncharacterized protein YigE (DUF2233 family)
VRVLSSLVSISDGSSRGDPVSNLERKARGLFLEDYQRRYGALAILSGGYFASFSPPSPLGFVKSNRISISSPHESWLTEGMLCTDEGRLEITLKAQRADRPEFRDCLQAGPLLLLNGQAPTNLPSRGAPGFEKLARSVQEQTFVCIDKQGKVILGVTEEADLAAVTEWLRRPDIGCADAIRLTGSNTSGLRVLSQLYGQDEYLFPSVIAVMNRQ